jgi:AraC-like DNA-binding protein
MRINRNKDRRVFRQTETTGYAPAAESYAAPAPPAVAPGVVRGDDVTRTVPLLGSGYRFSDPRLAVGEPVLRGVFQTVHLRPGLILQRTDVQDLHDMETSLTLNPALKIGLVVHGETEVRLGSLDFRLGPRLDNSGRLRNRGVVVAFAEPDTFRRRWRAGRREAKVSLTLLPEWLDCGGLEEGPALDRLRSFRHRHLAHEAWEPSPRALALAQQIVRPPDLLGPLQSLYLESRAIELASEALAQVMRAPAPAAPVLAVREHRRMRELQAWLDSAPAERLSTETIAREAGMSAATLQRMFRAATGNSLFEYLRARRLEAARLALERDGVSVGRAAELAGYASATNFSTAYRRRFGQAPGRARLRC